MKQPQHHKQNFLLLLGIILLSSSILLAQVERGKKICISLGGNCAPAQQFKMKKLSEAFFPFDWCITEFESIYKALETDFKDYIKLENLRTLELIKLSDNRVFRDTHYKIIYPHDFSPDNEPLHDYEFVRNKYYRRIDRFYQTLALGEKVYFFRTGITKKEAIQLNNLITKKFPTLNYALVVISDTQDFKKKWKIKHIKNFCIQGFQEAVMQSHTLRKDWDALFQDLKIIPKHMQKDASLTPLQKKRKLIESNRQIDTIKSR